MQIKTIPSIILNLLKKFSTPCFSTSVTDEDTLSVIDLSQVNRLAKGRKAVLKKRCKIN
jgi:hypothetical protein